MLWGWVLREADSVWCGGLSRAGTIYSPVQPPSLPRNKASPGEMLSVLCLQSTKFSKSLIPFLKKEFSTSHQNSGYNPARSREPKGLQ